MMQLRRDRRGYTLVELLVVLGILGLLASMAMPMVEVVVQREREHELKRALWEIRDAIDSYHQARLAGAIPGSPGASTYPPNLRVLTQALPDARPDRAGQVLRFLRRVPRDPFAQSELPPEETWGLRSYASEAAQPRPGVDVYDVYSLSDKVGLDGTRIGQW
jgi:general secretion pathway protein G